MTSTTKNNDGNSDLDRLSRRITLLQNRAALDQQRGAQESAGCFQQDAAALERVHKAVTAGHYRRAMGLVDRLDTALGEEIPWRMFITIYANK